MRSTVRSTEPQPRTPAPGPGPGRHLPRRLHVALVGADGAGKSTLSAELEHVSLPRPAKRLYMGVNLESSSLLLPTTRLLLAVKRARGGRPDMTASAWTPNDRERSLVTLARAGARFTIWSLEEWLRQAAAAAYTLRGYIVVFDRHFLLDYYHADVVGGTGRRSVWSRLHGWMLLHAYPKPDLVICLDAPAAVLHARKPESSVDWLEERRRQYLSLQELVPALVVLDVDRPLEDVLASVQQCITDHWEGAA